jgi:cytochrome P450
LETLADEQLEMMRHMLLVMDPPHHTAYRQPLAPHFGARVIGRMEEQIRARCRSILEAAGDKGEVDFVHEVAGPLPAQIIAEIMGLPQSDTPLIQQWAEVQANSTDEEIAGGYEGEASLDMAMYGMRWAAQPRAEPRREDLTALLLESTFEDGRQMDDIEFGGFFVQLVTAGNDTTKTMMSSGTYQLVQHPQQLQELRKDFSLIPNAVEEMLRYCNPLHYFRRTATRDTVLHGTEIKAGDKVAMYYTSANRDEDVFPDAQTFDIHRTPNPHLSFGIGAHFCLGAHLARLEAKIFFEELLSMFRTIEVAGEPVKTRSNLNNGFKRMPVRLAR